MVRFTFDIDGVPAFDRGFNRISETISDFRSIWPNVAKEFYAIEAGQFRSEGARGASGKWAPLSPAYLKYKAKAFPGAPILQATRSLVDSLTSPNALDSIFRPERDELIIGTQREGAVYHQRGAGKMPARPTISFTDPDKRQIQKAIQVGLIAFTRRAGFQVN